MTDRKVELASTTCEEASPLSRATFIPCGRPAVMIVWHNKDRRGYRMCDPCGAHNVHNRGGIRLVADLEYTGGAPRTRGLYMPSGPTATPRKWEEVSRGFFRDLGGEA